MNNEIIYSDDEFYISYLLEPSEFANALDNLCHIIGGRPAPTGQDETALCVRDDSKMFGTKFYILYGDHREAYRNLAKHGLRACLDYFIQNIAMIGHSSDTPSVSA